MREAMQSRNGVVAYADLHGLHQGTRDQSRPEKGSVHRLRGVVRAEFSQPARGDVPGMPPSPAWLPAALATTGLRASYLHSVPIAIPADSPAEQDVLAQ